MNKADRPIMDANFGRPVNPYTDGSSLDLDEIGFSPFRHYIRKEQTARLDEIFGVDRFAGVVP